MIEYGYPSPFMCYTYEHQSLGPDGDSIFFIKHINSNIEKPIWGF